MREGIERVPTVRQCILIYGLFAVFWLSKKHSTGVSSRNFMQAWAAKKIRPIGISKFRLFSSKNNIFLIKKSLLLEIIWFTSTVTQTKPSQFFLESLTWRVFAAAVALKKYKIKFITTASGKLENGKDVFSRRTCRFSTPKLSLPIYFNPNFIEKRFIMFFLAVLIISLCYSTDFLLNSGQRLIWSEKLDYDLNLFFLISCKSIKIKKFDM